MKKLLIILTVIFFAALSACKRDNAEEQSSITTVMTPEITDEKTETTTVSLLPVPTEIITLETTSPITSPEAVTEINPVVETAEALMGIMFKEDGASPAEGFDNSGFIYYVMRENGYISCPRQIRDQVDWGENAELSAAKPGDLLYFSDEPEGEASFGGIYAGENMMIYSPYPGEHVKKADISQEYWQKRFVTAVLLH